MERIGRYQVLSELGRGGMAIVYRALDPRFDREVAIKLLPKQFNQDPEFITRFQKEAKIIAALEHEAIVPVYDFGDHDDALYLVMRFMAGGSLLDRLQKGPLQIEEIAKIMDRLGPALDRAHRRGIIHRDIKPGNVFFDEDNLAYLGDFGIAKMAEGTQTMTIIGTPAYMSPEQAEGIKKLDWRTDIYSMGVLLFELLSGKQPYEAETATGQMLKHVMEPIPDVRAENPELPEDAQRIINMAMAKERSLRYQTVTALAEDVHKLLPEEEGAAPALSSSYIAAASQADPLMTQIDSAPLGYEDQLTVIDSAPQHAVGPIATQEKPAVAPPPEKKSKGWLWIVGILAVLILAAGSYFVVSSMGSANGSGDNGETNLAELPAATSEDYVPVVVPVNTPTITPEPPATATITPSTTPIPDADEDGILDADDECPKVAGSPAAAGCPATPTSTSIFPGFDGTPLPHGELPKISAANSESTQQLSRLGRGKLLDIRLDPGGEVLAAGSLAGLYLYDNRKLEELQFVDTGDMVRTLVYSPDGEILATTVRNKIDLWNSEDFELLKSFKGHAGVVSSMEFSPDGQTMVSSSLGSNDIYLWDVEGGELQGVLEGHTERVLSVAYSPDGKTAASGAADNTVRLWDPGSGQLLDTYEGHSGPVVSVAISPNGRVLASGGQDDAVLLWDISSGEILHTWKGHSDDINRVTFSPDGEAVASAAKDGTINLWNADSGELLQTIDGHTGAVESVLFSPDSSTLFSTSEDHTLRMWNAASGTLLNILERHLGPVLSTTLSPERDVAAAGYEDGSIRLWSTRDGRLLRVLKGHEGPVNGVVFSPDGRLLVSGSGDRTIRFWDAGDGTLLRTIEGHKRAVKSVAFSPDGSSVASGSADNTLQLWDVENGTQLLSLQGNGKSVDAVCWSADGRLIAAGIGDSIRVWQAEDGSIVRTVDGHEDGVFAVAFSPDGLMLASGGGDETARLWDLESGEVLQTLGGHNGRVYDVDFSPDGAILATASSDRNVRLWRVQGGRFLQDLVGHTQEVRSIDFSEDGTLMASGSRDGTIRLWGVSEK